MDNSAARQRKAKPTVQQLQVSLKRSKTLNIVLAAVAIFLGIVVLAQTLQAKDNPVVAAPEAGEVVDAPAENGEGEQPLEGEALEEVAEVPEGEREFVRRDAEDPMAIGDVNAPIVMTEWIDFQCPYCALFARDTLPTLIQDYVDSGDVRIEFLDVAYFGDGSVEGAAAARAAAEQGKYFEFMEAVYALPEGHPELNSEMLTEIAKEVGVEDLAKFEEDYNSEEVRQAVAQSTADAQAIGVTSVPFFVIENTPLTGAQPLDAFKDFIDGYLAEN